MKYSIGSSQYGLGDVLLLTTIAKHLPNKLTVQIPSQYSRFSILFDGLADVEITAEDKIMPIQDIGLGHYARRKLRSLFGSDAEYMDIRPLVLYSDRDSEKWVCEYLLDKPNPIIICPFVSKAWSQVRNLPFDIVQEILGQAKLHNQTPIFVQSETDQEWGHHTLNNLELCKLICLIRKVGQIATANTGVYHLATALSAKIYCFQPEDGPLFNSTEWCYESTPTIQHYTW